MASLQAWDVHEMAFACMVCTSFVLLAADAACFVGTWACTDIVEMALPIHVIAATMQSCVASFLLVAADLH